jgi:tRNA 2-thiouridine synthesizing protein B
VLHIISLTSNCFDIAAFLRVLAKNDAVLFVQNGVTNAISGHRLPEILAEKNVAVYALSEDLDARGLAGMLASTIAAVNYDEYVDLTVHHTPQLLW